MAIRRVNLPCASTLRGGTTDDWSYGELGIPSYTIEVGTQFMPPYGQIDSIQWPDNGPALQYAAKIARTPYRLAFGRTRSLRRWSTMEMGR